MNISNISNCCAPSIFTEGIYSDIPEQIIQDLSSLNAELSQEFLGKSEIIIQFYLLNQSSLKTILSNYISERKIKVKCPSLTTILSARYISDIQRPEMTKDFLK